RKISSRIWASGRRSARNSRPWMRASSGRGRWASARASWRCRHARARLPEGMSMEIATTATINLRYEDISLGSQFESAAHTVTEADIATFADVTRDHHPLHIDAAYAKSRGFPAVIAHGLYGLSLMEGLKSELKLYEETSVASLGWNDVQ